MENSKYVDGRYWSENASFHEEDAAFKAKNCNEAVKSYGLAGPLRVLDVGCGSGKFLYEFSELVEGDFLGIDLAEVAIARANHIHAKENVKFKLTEPKDISETFDLVTVNDVFEHVDDYIGFIKSIKPIGKNHYFNIPLDMHVLSVAFLKYMSARERVGHLHYFSKESALATLEYCGYSVLRAQLNQTALHRMDAKGMLSKGAGLVRYVAYKTSPEISVRLLGGASLGVLCRAM
ncbi:class I SAM-dependent methyltransferase [Mesorhizobium sp. M1399]|uniref:class I SAM-dependent methyltransferase n=1 Tax=Mesorhizobium sp. M1399 TaxID=2957096 RepID=UPI00333757DD